MVINVEVDGNKFSFDRLVIYLRVSDDVDTTVRGCACILLTICVVCILVRSRQFHKA